MKNKTLTDKDFDTTVKLFTIFTLLFFASVVALSDQIKVAVIDTGFDFNSNWANMGIKPNFCKDKLYNVTRTENDDNFGHGTHISSLVHKYAKGSNYCMVMIKSMDPNDLNIKNSARAIRKAIELRVDFINYSAGGTDFDEEECKAVKEALDHNITIVAAAGNEGQDLTKKPYYPAKCDKRVIVVESVSKDKIRSPFSNYGPGTVSEMGEKVLGAWLNNTLIYQSGTSQATAIHTGKLIKKLDKDIKMCDKGLCMSKGNL